MLLYLLKHLISIKSLDSEIQVAHEEHMLMINNGHLPLSQILLKCTVEYLHELLGSLVVFAAAGGEVTVDYHEPLALNLKANAYSSFVAADTGCSSFNSARLKRLRWYPGGKLPFQEDGKVAANHLFVRVDKFLIVKFLFFVRSSSIVALICSLHNFCEHGTPHFQLLIIFHHHVLSVEADHFL
jgi:hypothetical protein